MKAPRAFTVLGSAWAVMIVLELLVMAVTNVSTPACVAAIFLRGVLAGAAFGIAHVIRRGETNVPVKPLAIGYAVVAVLVTVVGLGMSVSPGSSLGFLAFSREDTFDRMPNVFLPEFRQSMNAANSTLRGPTLHVFLTLVVVSIVCARRVPGSRRDG